MEKRILAAFIALLLFVVACKKDDDGEELVCDSTDTQLNNILNGLQGGKAALTLPASNDFQNIPQDPQNPLTSQKVALGKMLFHETGISTIPKMNAGERTYSCASCHHAPAGFQAGIAQGIGEGGSGYGTHGGGRVNDQNWPVDSLDVQPIRTPTTLNVAYQKVLLWNGQFGGTGPNVGTESQWTVGSPKEANNLGYEGAEIQAIAGLKVHRLEIDQGFFTANGYASLFQQAFPGLSGTNLYTSENAGLAVAAYERTLLPNEAPFQRWLQGESDAMTESQKQGAMVFFNKGNCVSCHNGPALNSMEFHAIGMKDLDGPGFYGTTGAAADATNKGRGGFTGVSSEEYQFKVPQLYNLSDSPFYGHGGNFTSIKAVIDYKNAAQSENSNVPATQLATGFQPLNLSDSEVTALVDFLENALHDPNLNRYVPDNLPSGNCFPNADAQSKIDLNCP